MKIRLLKLNISFFYQSHNRSAYKYYRSHGKSDSKKEKRLDGNVAYEAGHRFGSSAFERRFIVFRNFYGYGIADRLVHYI